MASEQAETYLRLMAHAELRRALKLPRVRRATATSSAQFVRLEREDPSEGLSRLAQAADALTAADAIDADVAHGIVAKHEMALTRRHRNTWRHGWRASGRRSSDGPPAGAFFAVGIGERVSFDVDGAQAEVLLLALIIGPDRAVLSIVGKPPPTDADEANQFLEEVTVTDSEGDSYLAMFSGGGDDDEWTGEIELQPPMEPTVRFIDVTVAPGAQPVRIALDWATPAPPPLVTPVEPAERRDRYLDALTAKLFEADPQGNVKAILRTLLDVGVVEPVSPAVTRLATVARRVGADLPPDLAQAPPATLPERWASVLDHLGATDGPAGVAPAAVVLPEFDNARWVIGGLRSLADRAELRAYGWGDFGTFDDYRTDITLGLFGWWARDDRGRWHIATVTGGGWDQEHADMTLKLTPPLDPQATSLDVIVTGRTGQVTVTLPLRWRGASAE